MKIFITGANGFVGRHLVEELLKHGDIEIIALHRSPLSDALKRLPVSWIQGDITKDRFKSDLHAVDYVFHCAASIRLDNSAKSKSELEKTNVDATIRLAEDSLEAGVSKFIYTSSIAAREESNRLTVAEEEGQPVSCYGISKMDSEKRLKSCLHDRMDYLIFRPTALFGEYHEGSFYELVKVIDNNRYIMIGDGKNSVNFLYVKDCVLGMIAGAFSILKNETLIINHHPTTLKEFSNYVRISLGKKKSSLFVPKSVGMFAGLMADVISKATGMKLPISQKRVKAMCRDIYYSPGRLLNTGVYQEKYGLFEGVKRTVNWFENSMML
jgi:nucleoside-diphosphate-sugar epimerase